MRGSVRCSRRCPWSAARPIAAFSSGSRSSESSERASELPRARRMNTLPTRFRHGRALDPPALIFRTDRSRRRTRPAPLSLHCCCVRREKCAPAARARPPPGQRPSRATDGKLFTPRLDDPFALARRATPGASHTPQVCVEQLEDVEAARRGSERCRSLFLPAAAATTEAANRRSRRRDGVEACPARHAAAPKAARSCARARVCVVCE